MCFNITQLKRTFNMAGKIDQTILDDVTIFASVILKLRRNNTISLDMYKDICKTISDLVQCNDDVETRKLYNYLQTLYKKYSWWAMYNLHNKNNHKKNVMIRKNNRSCLSVMSR